MPMVKICPVDDCRIENDEYALNCKECDVDLTNISAIDSEEIQFEDQTNTAQENYVECQHLHLTPQNRCLDCGEMVTLTVSTPSTWIAQFPWGEETEINSTLWIGRIMPTSTELAQRLEKEYSNISRNHAELYVEDNHLYIRDLRSTNGTFLNNNRLSPMNAEEVQDNATIRFAKDLEIHIRRGSQ
jgi:hypothetical protein